MNKTIQIFAFFLLFLTFLSQAAYAQPTITFTNLKHECDGSENGQVDITVTAGVAPFNLFILGNRNFLNIPLTLGVPFTADLLPDGSYTVIVQDGSPTDFSGNFAINDIAPNISASVSTSQNNLDNTCTAPNGFININVAGGSGIYDFAWTGPGGYTATTQNISNLAGGDYNLTITDVNASCSFILPTETLTDPLPTVFNISTTDSDLCDGDDLTIDLSDTENGVTYTVFVGGVATATSIVGDGNPNSIIYAGPPALVDSDVVTVGASLGLCTPVLMNGTINAIVRARPAGGNDTDAICSGSNASYDLQNNINTLGNAMAGVTFSWLAADNADVTGESLVAQAGGTIGDNLVNTSNVDQVVIYTITPTGPAPGFCSGNDFTVSITVHPDPAGGNDTDAICSGDNVTYDLQNNINTLGNGVTGVTFSWLAADNADVTGESLVAQAGGTIGDNLLNTSNVDQVVTYTITPTGPAPGNCAGADFTVSVTIHPTPVGGNDTDAICSGDNAAYDLQNNINTLGNGVAGVTFSWIAADNADVTGESLVAQAGGIIGDNLVNSSGVDQQVVYTVTPTGPGTCPGNDFTITITVYPDPIGGNDTDAICSGDNAAYDLQNNINTLGNGVAGVTFSWIAADNADVTGESLVTQAGGTIGDNLVNTSNAPQVVIYTITPTGPAPGNCAGADFTVNITVNPDPIGDDDTGEICSGDNVTYDLQNNINTLGNGVTGVTFSWLAADNADVTGESLVAQAGGTIGDNLVNTSNTDQIVVYTVTPTGPAPGNCAGADFTVSITVHPTPVGDNDTDAICSGDNAAYDLQNNINTLGNGVAGVTFSWLATDNADVTGESLVAQAGGTIGDNLVNTSNTDQVVVYTVTPTGPAPNNCTGADFTVSITVHPDPIGDDDTGEICSGDNVTYDLQNNINTLGNGVAGVMFSWIAADNADVTGESLVAQAGGTIGDNLVNTSNTDQVVQYTVTPTAPGGCAGADFTVSITVHPDPIGDDDTGEICSGDNVTYDLQNNINTLGNGVTGVTFSWLAADNADVTGESLIAQGAGTIGDNLVNTSNTDQVVVYTVTPTGPAPGNCAGSDFTVSITVHPTPVGDNDTDAICSGDNAAYDLQNNINTLGNGVAGVTFSWLAADNADVTGESLVAQAGGTIGDNLVNTSNTDQIVIYTVTPTGPAPGSCAGADFTVSITVHPDPIGDDDAGEICSGDNAAYDLQNNINTLGNGVTGVTFSWLAADNADVTGESLVAQAGGTIGDNLVNTSNTDQVVQYTVTPTAPGGCAGADFIVSITVHPDPIGDDDTGEICSGDNAAYDLQNNINTLGNGVTGVAFNWLAADNTDVTGESLVAQAGGTIGDNLVNTSNTDQVVVYTVTPTGPAPGNCAGADFTVSITVHPTPVGGNDTDAICSGDNAAYDLQNNINTLGNGVAGVTFSWLAADNTDVTGESLVAQAGGTIGDNLVNTSNTDQVVQYTVTPTAPGGCAGADFTVSITVHPDPIGDDDTGEICSGDNVTYDLQNNINTLGNGVAGVTFSWLAADNADVTGESLVAQGGGTIGDNLVNTSNTDQVVVYTVTPTGPAPGNCAGADFTVSITVYPDPIGDDDTGEICSGANVTYDLQNNINTLGNGVTGVTFSWLAADNTDVTGESLVAQGGGTIGDNLVNTSNTDQVVVYTVTPTGPAPGNCAGADFTVSITVHPTPVGGNDTDAICSGDNAAYDLQNNINILGNGVAGITFSWLAADNADVTGESLVAQAGGTIGDNLVNTSNTDQVVVYTVTPTGPAPGNCAGADFTVSITVHPDPIGDDDTGEICSGGNATYDLQNNINTLGNGVTGVTFSWLAADNADVTGESLVAQAGGTIGDNLVNTSNTDQVVVYTVTPTGPAPGNCAGADFTVSITVHPDPIGDDDTDAICSGDNAAYDLQNNINTLGNGVAGITFSWLAADNADVTGESLVAQAGGTIGDNLVNTTNTDQIVVYTVTPTGPAPGNCAGVDFTVSITVHPTPVGGNDTDAICSGDNAAYDLQNNINTLGNGVAGVTFSWLAADNTDVTGESLVAQAGGTIGDNLVNTSNTDQVVVYTVTPTAPGGCAGADFTVSLTVHPDPIGDDDTDAICSGDNAAYDLQNNINTLGNALAGVTFSWLAADNADVTGESLVAQAGGTIGDNLVNTSNTDQVVVYTVTPTGPAPGNCAGADFTISITVHPKPEGLNDTAESCSGNALSYDLQNNINVLGNSVAGIAFSWIAAPNPDVTGESTVAQAGNTINDVLVNVTGSDKIVVYTVTPTAPGNCIGNTFLVNVTVSASASADAGSDETICSGTVYALAGSGVGGAGSTGAWSITNGPAGGDGILSSTAQVVDPSLVTFEATVAGEYELTLTTDDPAGACTAGTDQVVIKVTEPPIIVSSQSKTICGNESVSLEILLTPLNQPAGTIFNWPDPDGTGPATAGVNVSMGAPGTPHINDIITNSTSSPFIITYQVTPSIGTCIGVPEDVEITVRPTPVLANSQTKTICSGENADYEILLNPLNTPSDVTFSWPDPDGPGPATSRVDVPEGAAGTLHITDKLFNGSASPILVRYSILAKSNLGCTAQPRDIDITVNPGAVVEAGSSTLMCSGGTLGLSGSSIGGLATTGTWSIISSPAAGDGILSNTNPVAVPSNETFTATIAGDYVLRLTTDDPAGSCPVVADDITITVRSATDPLCTGGPGGPGGGGGNINCTVFTATVTESRPSCADQDDGQISITVSGGTPSPNYVITLFDSVSTDIFTKSVVVAPGNTQVFDKLSPSINYFYQIDDGTNICTLPYSLPLQTTVTASLDPASVQDVACFGQPTGSVVINATGSSTGEYFYSVDGTTWKEFVPGNPGEITDLPPLGTYTVLVGESSGDVCHDTVSVTINNANPEITADFDITAASCDANDGAITGIVAGGGSGSGYQFSIDGGQNFQTDADFNGISGGVYTLKVKDDLGCEADFNNISVTFPGFIDFTATSSNAVCNNNGKSGVINVVINGTGTGYKAAVTSDPFNAPSDSEFRNYSEPFLPFEELTKGTYYVYVKSDGALCPNPPRVVNVDGAYAIDFDIQPLCNDLGLSVSLENITVAPTTPFDISITKTATGEVIADTTVVQNGSVPTVFFQNGKFPFLNAPDEYDIQIKQVQILPSNICPIESEKVSFIVPDLIVAEVDKMTASFPDINSGSFELTNISGGVPFNINGAPSYVAEIELETPAIPGQAFQSGPDTVRLNPDKFRIKYDFIPPGVYTVVLRDGYGCVRALTATIPLNEDIFIPNIFTPNEDGTNDLFYIRNLPVESGNVKLVISSRWGKEVFSSTNYQNDWRGEGATDGIYFYRLQIEGSDPVTGWVEVLRGQKP